MTDSHGYQDGYIHGYADRRSEESDSGTDLAGIAELAKIFDVGASTVSNWHSRRSQTGMPEPLASLKCGTVFSRSAVIAWWAGWQPLNGYKVGTLPVDEVPSAGTGAVLSAGGG